VGAVANQPLRLRDSIREMRRSHVRDPHAGMELLKRLRILSWRDVARRDGLVVSPQRHSEAVTNVDAWLHSMFKFGHWAIGFGEPPSDVNFESGACLIRYISHPGKNVTGQQANSEPVGVVNNNRVIGGQAKRRGRGHTRRHRTRNF
jgi:hypothetical protein